MEVGGPGTTLTANSYRQRPMVTTSSKLAVLGGESESMPAAHQQCISVVLLYEEVWEVPANAL